MTDLTWSCRFFAKNYSADMTNCIYFRNKITLTFSVQIFCIIWTFTHFLCSFLLSKSPCLLKDLIMYTIYKHALRSITIQCIILLVLALQNPRNKLIFQLCKNKQFCLRRKNPRTFSKFIMKNKLIFNS